LDVARTTWAKRDGNPFSVRSRRGRRSSERRRRDGHYRRYSDVERPWPAVRVEEEDVFDETTVVLGPRPRGHRVEGSGSTPSTGSANTRDATSSGSVPGGVERIWVREQRSSRRARRSRLARARDDGYDFLNEAIGMFVRPLGRADAEGEIWTPLRLTSASSPALPRRPGRETVTTFTPGSSG